jgi:SNF2 family DNA or RNA helicase
LGGIRRLARIVTPAPSRGSLEKVRDSTEYYPHQLEGIRTMARMTSFLLADEMGLGKTLQSLTVAAIDFEQKWAQKVIVVCPATLKWNWQDEIETHTKFTSMVLDGSPKKRKDMLALYAEGGIDVLICNYEQIKTHLDALNRIAFDIGIFDEAHYLKNPKAQRTKASLGLSLGRAFCLTGSPVLNQVNELWAILNRIDKESFPNYWRFVNRYAVFGGYQDKQIVGVKHQAELNGLLAQYMIRRRKADVLDLPDKQRISVKVDLTPEQRKLYKQAVDDMRIDLPDTPEATELENALTRMLRLKQICGTTAALYDLKDFAAMPHSERLKVDKSEKLDRALEMVQELVESGERVVVFTQFRVVQLAFETRLQAAGIPVWSMNGDTAKQDRAAMVRSWGDDARPGVMLAMLQVAGVGLNMTQSSHAIFLDKLWVPKLNEQAEDRLHRIGADVTQPVQIYELITRDTIEQRIEVILRRKTKLFNTLVEESDWKRELTRAIFAADEEE